MAKLLIDFPHRLALSNAPQGAKLRFALMHGILGLSFLLPVFGPLAAIILCLLVSLPGAWKTNVYLLDAHRFLMQRILLVSLIVGVTVTLMQTPQGLPYIAWRVLTFTLLPLCVYDGWLAWQGIPGLFYIRRRKVEGL